MNFRPVNTATGPDGCLYIVDMYRGIIQESEWTKPGSYLRPEIVNRGLDMNTSRGRIYRVVHDGIKPDKTLPRMLSQPSAQLIPYLANANGWWRENAQKILVVRGDKTIAPALTTMALSGANQLARIHALWTLNGLDALDMPTLLQAFQDKDPEVRRTAVWIAEEEVRKGDNELVSALEALKNDPNADVRYQLALTLRFNDSEKAQAIKEDLIRSNPQDIAMVASQDKYQHQIKERLAKEKENNMLAQADQKLVMEGATIFKQLCATCHGADGKGVLNGGKGLPAPALSGAKDVNGDPEKLIKILLHGLSGPVDGKTYTDVMPALGFNSDEYIASVLSYIRNDLGNKASMVKAADVKKVRAATSGRTKNWTIAELDALKK